MSKLPLVLRERDFALLVVSFFAMSLASQMVAVGVGWQVYSIHGKAFDLGLIGLAEFVPLPLLALPAGQLADRLSRRLVFAVSLVVAVGVTAGLLVVSLSGARTLWPFLALSAGTGVASALGTPAARALIPMLLPAELLASGIAVRTVAAQAAVVGGPALGGVLFAVRPELVYELGTGMFVLSLLCVVALHERVVSEVALEEPPGLQSLLGGIRFLGRAPIVLGAILLDLFAVLFGGAVALLPLFAKTILHTGPIGLGVLRTAPAAGALVAGVMLTRRPLGRRAGRTLLLVVAIFGVTTVVFGLSRSLPLSLAALAVGGFADMFSVNIRSTTVALATPDELRGRVNAVEMVFVSASNELGAFESGLAAALVGAVPAVVGGGVATVAIALVWPRLFPTLAHVDRLEHLEPAVEAAKD